MSHPEPPQPVATPRRFRWRRLCQYRVRTLLIVVCLLAIPLGWVSVERAKSARERIVAHRVFALGGMPFFESETSGSDAGTWQFRLRRAILGERIVDISFWETSLDDISFISELTSLRHFIMRESAIQNIAPLANLTNLEVLILTTNKIDDIRALATLRRLEHLRLDKTQVHDLSPLSGLTNLEYLRLDRTKIRDVTPLAGLKELQHLNLEYTSVQDLSPLAGLSQLKSLYLCGTPVSHEQVEWLQKRLPECFIEYDEPQER